MQNYLSNTGSGDLKRGGEKHSINQITSKNSTQNCGQKVIEKHKAETNPTFKTTQTRCEKKKREKQMAKTRKWARKMEKRSRAWGREIRK